MQGAKEFIGQVYETVRTRDIDALVELFSEDCVFIDMAMAESAEGRAAFRAYMDETFVGMPDFRPETWEFVEEGDRIAAELVLSGTHLGTFMGYPPTNRVVRWHASAFYTLTPAHDSVVREVYYYDLASLTSQLAADHA
ncbi:MAG: ester cyclase [Chloroflexota bacterium]|nr:ester cyclase [Chloroflexota bacterium]